MGALALAAAAALREPAFAAEVPDLAQVANALGRRLMDRAPDDPNSNAVLSPLSIGYGSAIAAWGANGASASEFEKVLGLGAGASLRLPAAAQALTGKLERSGQLSLANAIAFASGGNPLHPRFVEQANAAFGTAMLERATRETVNAWVSRKTNGKIARIVDAAFEIALVNALHFEAAWERPAQTYRTRPDLFTTARGTVVSVPTMTMSGVRAIERPEFEAFALPYQKRAAAMLIVLPKRGQPIRALARSLAPGMVRECVARPEVLSGDDDLELPLFAVGRRVDLRGPLGDLGLTTIFDENLADFTRMSSSRLKVDAVVHAAALEVNEAGTVATASTAITLMPPGAVGMPRRIFRVDRPFLFFLVHLASAAVMMQGLVNDPTIPVA